MSSSNNINRRKFLKMMAAGTCGAACHQVLWPTNGMMAFAAQPTGKIKNYVELYMYGGCDTYGLCPEHNAGAQQRMGSLYRNAGQCAALPNSPDLSMHSAFAPLIAEVNSGVPHLAVIVGAGSMAADLNYSRSHDEAQTASQRLNMDYRPANSIGIGAAIAQQIAHPFSLVSFDGASDFTIGGAIPARSVSSLENGGKPGFSQDEWFNLTESNAKAAAGAAKTEEQQYIRDSIITMNGNLATLATLGAIQTPLAFPNTGLGRNLEDVTRLIMSNVGARVFTVAIGGFDTHSNEANQHQQLFTTMNNALLAFVRNLKAVPGVSSANAWNETALVMRTDFGRTFTNGAAGTDHGFTFKQVALGGSIRGGVYGDVPNAAKYQNEPNNYAGPSWMQFNAGQVSKEIVQIGMALPVEFPAYVGNIYSPLGIVL